MDQLEQLQKVLGYRFQDTGLLEIALTHRSASSNNNERLEFLGDSILNFVIAADLFDRFPKASEGQLSRLRSSLVKGDTLAKIAKDFSLGDYLRLGSGELKSGGYRRSSILADTVEAIFGAVLLDAGVDACRQLILACYASRLEVLTLDQVSKDPKTQLQEYLQSRKQALPVYDVIDTTGAAHNQTFFVRCTIESLSIEAQAQGSSRRKAEQAAASEVIKLLPDLKRST